MCPCGASSPARACPRVSGPHTRGRVLPTVTTPVDGTRSQRDPPASTALCAANHEGAVTPLPNRPNRRARDRQCTASPRAIAPDAPKHGGSSCRGRMLLSGGGGRRVFWDEGPGDLRPTGSASALEVSVYPVQPLEVDHHPRKHEKAPTIPSRNGRAGANVSIRVVDNSRPRRQAALGCPQRRPPHPPSAGPAALGCPRPIPFQRRGHRHARAAARTIRSTFPASDSGNVT